MQPVHHGAGGVSMPAGRPGLTRTSGDPIVSHGSGGVAMPGGEMQGQQPRAPVPGRTFCSPGGAPLQQEAPPVPAGTGTGTGTAAQPRISAQEAYTDRPSAAREAREMFPAQLDKGGQEEALRHTVDNTAGYDAGTGSRGGGSGGTTEAMTGGLAAGGGLGDERRAGMGDLPRSM